MNKSHSLSTLLFLAALILSALKLFGAIDWSWWTVLSPIWVPPLFFGFLGLFLFTLFAWRAGHR